MTNKRLSVKETARLMEAGEQFIRIGLQKGKFPFGYAVKISSVWTYFISAAKFTEFTGIAVDGGESPNCGLEEHDQSSA